MKYHDIYKEQIEQLHQKYQINSCPGCVMSFHQIYSNLQ